MVAHQEPDRETHQHEQQVHDVPLLARDNGRDLVGITRKAPCIPLLIRSLIPLTDRSHFYIDHEQFRPVQALHSRVQS
jgi:hypothetical protein